MLYPARFLSVLLGLLLPAGSALFATAQVRDGGIDPWNLGQGEWLYYMSSATNRLGGNVASVTNEASLMLYLKSQGIRYVIVKAATSDQLFNGSYSFPQFNSNLVEVAHANGMLIFGYNRSYGANVPAEIAISDYVFQQGADGFVWDAEAEWESNQEWIGTNGPALAWQLCSAVRSNWPTKFLAHAPFPIISYHSSFPYKEFGYWCDAVMPQIYHFSSSGLKRSTSAGIEWTDVNWAKWQASLAGQSSVIDGQTIWWTNAIKPLVPIQDVYGPLYTSPTPDKDVMEFLDYLACDPNCVTPGGYKGANFFRADLHGAVQWSHIKAGELGSFPGVVNNLVMDDAAAACTGAWTMQRTFYNGSFYGSGSDTNSFGTNYWYIGRGLGSNCVQFTPRVSVPGDYYVYQWHPFLPNASGSVPFTINYYGGSATVLANQKTNSGNWSLLGKFYFDLGTNATVTVSDALGDSNTVAMVDGLKLVFVPPKTRPAAPLALVARPVGPTQIVVGWVDQSPNETGFAIARGLSAAGPFADVGSVPANVRTYLDPGLNPHTTYYYQVRATNFLGASPAAGPVSATTPHLTPVLGWGDGTWDQLFAPESGTNAIAIAAGEFHSLALTAGGRVCAWGDNWNEQCNVPPELADALAVAAGGYHGLAVRRNLQVAAWGANDYGQAEVPADLEGVMAVAGGTWHSLALRRNGTIVGWGDNSAGQTSVPEGLSNATALAAGTCHSLALRSDGTVIGWGGNCGATGEFAGQANAPFGLSGVRAIAAGNYHSVALLTNGTVAAWGDNTAGQCSVAAGLSNVVAVSAGGMHTLALLGNGGVVSWGANGYGQCAVPAGLTTAVAIAAGQTHSLVLQSNTSPVLELLSPVAKAGRFSVLCQTWARNHYALERTDSLPGGNWTPITTNSGNGALQSFSIPVSGEPSQFYRLRRW